MKFASDEEVRMKRSSPIPARGGGILVRRGYTKLRRSDEEGQ